jgi:ribonuclease BN (tRNA processing enzyme)
MIEIIFIGTGSAFPDCNKNYNSNILIKNNQKYFLLDAGHLVNWGLNELGLSYKNIDSIYISHLHGDHCAGLEEIAFKSYFDSSNNKINLYGEHNLIQQLWNERLKGSLKSINKKQLELKNYFNIEETGIHFYWQNLYFKIIPSIHLLNPNVWSYGLMIEDLVTKKKIWWTSDCQFDFEMNKNYYEQVDLIIHDCETENYFSGVHTHYNQLKTLPNDIKQKIVLNHYNDNVLQKDYNSHQWFVSWKNQHESIKDRFKQFAQKGWKNIIVLN